MWGCARLYRFRRPCVGPLLPFCPPIPAEAGGRSNFPNQSAHMRSPESKGGEAVFRASRDSARGCGMGGLRARPQLGHIVIHTHHNMFQTLTRALPVAQNVELSDWLTAPFPVWQRLTPEMIKLCVTPRERVLL